MKILNKSRISRLLVIMCVSIFSTSFVFMNYNYSISYKEIIGGYIINVCLVTTSMRALLVAVGYRVNRLILKIALSCVGVVLGCLVFNGFVI